MHSSSFFNYVDMALYVSFPLLCTLRYFSLKVRTEFKILRNCMIIFPYECIHVQFLLALQLQCMTSRHIFCFAAFLACWICISFSNCFCCTVIAFQCNIKSIIKFYLGWLLWVWVKWNDKPLETANFMDIHMT